MRRRWRDHAAAGRSHLAECDAERPREAAAGSGGADDRLIGELLPVRRFAAMPVARTPMCANWCLGLERGVTLVVDDEGPLG